MGLMIFHMWFMGAIFTSVLLLMGPDHDKDSRKDIGPIIIAIILSWVTIGTLCYMSYKEIKKGGYS